jgi:23S rRNA (cytidine1920-2'-O)/16S rRNA (cytidine1409-2'-O)-methyltransferase
MEHEKESEYKARLDVEMLSRGLSRSRSAASDLIKRGKVNVNGKPTTKPNTEVVPADRIEVMGGVTFVSRAGEKLQHALSSWKIDPTGMTAIDIGSSTGGFTDCLLQSGAAKVIAIDVGKDQLDASLRNDPRVEVHEETDIRKFSALSPADLVVTDVSFISLEYIMPKISECMKKGSKAVVLVKPQFEVGKEIADRHKGIITDESEQKNALERVKGFAKKSKLKVISETASPIEGEKGNKEFLLLLQK